MSNLRQQAIACPSMPCLVTSLTWEYKDGESIPEHFHPEDQLVYASRGVMTVRAQGQTWVVPPHRAVWIPARVPHRLAMSGSVSMRTLYFRARFVKSLPRSCRVVNVSPLLRELILYACTFPKLERRNSTQAHLIDSIVDQLRAVEAVPLQLPAVSDARAQRVADALAADPGRDVDRICREAGASKRTIERLFHTEANMSLGEWRQQLRLMRALQLLASGEKITRVALDTGYSTASAFISMFRRALGQTPRRYFAT